MEKKNVVIQIKVIAEFEGQTYESLLDYKNGISINGFRSINSWDFQEALKRYILRNCDDDTILEALAQDEHERRMLAYNPHLSHELADRLAEELFEYAEEGIYLYELGILMTNPCVSGQELDSIANRLLDKYKYVMKTEGRPDYEVEYLLRNIARNTAVWESTLEALKNSQIPTVVEATKH